MRPYSQNVFFLVVAIIGFGKRQLKSRRGALGSRVDLIFQKNWHRYSCAILSYTLNISIARSLILCMETSKAWRDSGSVPFSLSQFLCSFFLPWSCVAIYIWLTENLPPKFNHNNVCCSSWRFWLPKARSRHVLQDYLKERWLFIQGGKFFTIDRNNYYYWFEQVWKVPCCRMLRTFFLILLHRRDCEDETGMDTGLRFDDR